MDDGGPATIEAVFFDLFGTLLSLEPLASACDELAPGRGVEIAARWRARQLEATWLRTLMQRWADFDVITRETLHASLTELGIAIPRDLDVAGAFANLPLADGAAEAVGRVHDAGLATGILTNASERTLGVVADRLDLPIDHLLSVDRARRYKPAPDVYRLAVEATGLPAGRIGFVSANGWDAAGAAAFGFRVAWLRPGAGAVVPAVGAPEVGTASWQQIPSTFRSERLPLLPPP